MIRLKIERRLVEVERLWESELTIEEAARQLKVSPRTIRVDRKTLFERYKESQLQTHDDRVVHRTRELKIVMREAMKDREEAKAAYFRAQEPKETITVTKDALGNLETTVIKEEGQNGDPKYLALAEKALEIYMRANAELRKLYGDNVQQTDEHEHLHLHAHNHQQTVVVVEDERWYGNDAHGKSAEATAASSQRVIEPSEIQGGGLRTTMGKNGNGAANGH